ncbi:YbjQ family protein [Candidatus Micrarchaeota archaeon]|nr:YbjQ family protein [Candidatus Micrarchaeota archaeon]
MADDLLVSTLHSVPGYRVKSYRGLVWASTARSKNFLMDIVEILKSLVGGEQTAYRNMMNEARKEIVHELVSQAKRHGANAVVGVSFGSTQILPATLDIFAYGTAVIIEKERKR